MWKTRGKTPGIRWIRVNTFQFTLICATDGTQKDPIRDGKEQAEDTNQAATVNHHRLFTRKQVYSTDDGQIAVNTEAGQREDTTVEIELKREGNSYYYKTTIIDC